MKRLLMYSQDGMGLGHLTRSSNVAREVLARAPGCDVLILADSPATSLLAARNGIDVLKLPTIVKTGSASWKATSWRNGSLHSDMRQIVALRAKLILQTFMEFRPDAVVIDHMPVGALGELKPLLESAASSRKPPKLFLGLRDILDSPAVIRRAWRELGGYDYLDHYDAVLVYGTPHIYDATAAYHLLPRARSIRYCNYVAPGSGAPPEPRPMSKPFVLMMGGGGSDAFPLAAAFQAASPFLHTELGMETVALTGPNMAPEDRMELFNHADNPARIQTGFGRADVWIRHASAIITLAGYNSLCEVLRWQRKALVVPRPGPSAEQQTRGRLFSERGLVRMLDPSELSPRRLADEVVELLRDDDVPRRAGTPPLDGAERAAEIILDGTSSLAPTSSQETVAAGGNGSAAGSGIAGVSTSSPLDDTRTASIALPGWTYHAFALLGLVGAGAMWSLLRSVVG